MKPTAKNIVAIDNIEVRTPISAAQKLFNQRIKQIDAKRVKLAAWETQSVLYQAKYDADYLPLLNQYELLQVQMIKRLDWASQQKGLAKTHRATVAELICSMVADLSPGVIDDDVKAIFHQHSGIDAKTGDDMQVEFLKAMIEKDFGITLGDECQTVQQVMARIFQIRAERAAADETEGEAAHESNADKGTKRKKSAKQVARANARASEEKEISQSIREVYRKLASALHPDREPDTAERERKTLLMQRVNRAYDSRNLLQLLELQLELEHIDQAAINQLSERQLKHYNAILREQLHELDRELYKVLGAFCDRFNIDIFARLTPATLLGHLATDIKTMQSEINILMMELHYLTDIKALKPWLRDKRLEMQDQYEFDENVFDIF